jgi:membrane protein
MKNIFNKPWIKKTVGEIKKIAQAWSNSQASTYGASVAYYTVFSIAPLLVIAISIAGLFLNQQMAEQSIISQFATTFGKNGADFIHVLIQSQTSAKTNILLIIIGFLVLFIGATGIFSQLQLALDTIFESLPEKNVKGIWGTIKQKLLSFGMVLSVGFLLLISLALSALITALSGYLTTLIPSAEALAQIIELSVSFVLISFFLALTYKILPSKKLRWKPALVGGAIAGLLFVISKYVLGLYLGSSEAFTSYGAASSLVLLILWTYYMSQVFFFAAILTRLYIVPEVK